MTYQHSDLEAGRALRDQGIQQTMSANRAWSDLAEAEFIRMAALSPVYPRYMTGQEIRVALGERGVPEPSNPNAWGGFISGLVKRKYLFPTGNFKQTALPQSHARITRVYFIDSTRGGEVAL
jgi:hypothetical protein